MKDKLDPFLQEVKDNTPFLFDPSWHWAVTFQNVAYCMTAAGLIEKALVDPVDPDRVRNLVDSLEWLANQLKRNLPP